jgi:hypothetical protein
LEAETINEYFESDNSEVKYDKEIKDFIKFVHYIDEENLLLVK